MKRKSTYIQANLLTARDIGVLYSALEFEILQMEANVLKLPFLENSRNITVINKNDKALEELRNNERYKDLLEVKGKMNDVYVNFIYNCGVKV